MYKLIATDIDGTLIRDDKKISDKTQNAIKEWVDRGNYFILVSGRAYNGVLPLVKMLNLDKTYHVAYNGNVLFDIEENLEIMTYFDEEEYKTLVNHLRKTCKSFVVMDGQNMLYETEDISANKIMIPNNGAIDFVKIDDALEVKNPFQICAYYDKLDNANAILSKKYETILGCVSNPVLIDFYPKSINKAKGLLKIGELLGVKKEEMIAVGDNDNDIDMIQAVGCGVAVKNGTDNLKNNSDEVLEYTNNEEALYHLIEKYI